LELTQDDLHASIVYPTDLTMFDAEILNSFPPANSGNQINSLVAEIYFDTQTETTTVEIDLCFSEINRRTDGEQCLANIDEFLARWTCVSNDLTYNESDELCSTVDTQGTYALLWLDDLSSSSSSSAWNDRSVRVMILTILVFLLVFLLGLIACFILGLLYHRKKVARSSYVFDD